MKIWIDLANAPHVNFFQQIILGLRKRGHAVGITIRDFNQTPELASLAGIDGVVIGKHGGRGSFRKILNLLDRSFNLFRYCLKNRFDVAVSHNSYAQAVAGRLAGARVITIMDYEGQPANHIAFRAAHVVAVPDCFGDEDLKRFGARKSKVYKYDGFKEEVYLSRFNSDPQFVNELKKACGFEPDWELNDHILVTVRPPASIAAYHNFHNHTFDKLLNLLNGRRDLTTVILPRYPEQRLSIKRQYPGLCIPDRALSGNDLVFFSDLIISGGGTMNREAAVLGTPAYTIFGGLLPAVDQKLISLGRLKSIRTVEDLKQIRYEKKEARTILRNVNLLEEFINLIEYVPGDAMEPAIADS